MAYDEKLAMRVREVLEPQAGINEKRMFGGLSFMFEGNLCCGIVGEDLMVRVGPDNYEEALLRPGARQMDFTGKPLKGMVYVSREGWKTDVLLDAWIELGIDYASSLPKKRR